MRALEEWSPRVVRHLDRTRLTDPLAYVSNPAKTVLAAVAPDVASFLSECSYLMQNRFPLFRKML